MKKIYAIITDITLKTGEVIVKKYTSKDRNNSLMAQGENFPHSLIIYFIAIRNNTADFWPSQVHQKNNSP